MSARIPSIEALRLAKLETLPATPRLARLHALPTIPRLTRLDALPRILPRPPKRPGATGLAIIVPTKPKPRPLAGGAAVEMSSDNSENA